MVKPTQHLHLDFETYCDLDLRKVGIYRYVAHPSFRVLCTGWKFDGHRTLYDTSGLLLAGPLGRSFRDPDVQVHAWNAAFETAVLAQLGIKPARPISCTMQRALAYGLPARLEIAARALGVAHQKDKDGHRLMLKMCRPQKPGAASWGPADLTRLGQYCAGDAEAEADVAAVIPELPDDERELSQLDAIMNTSGGLGIDWNRVMYLKAVAEAAEKADATRCEVLTGGAVTSPGTQTARLLKWLESKGFVLPDAARATVEDALMDIRTGPDATVDSVAEVLAIRLRAARASTRKLARMAEMADFKSGALEGQFQFCGAGRTGRWSGRGVQVQNLPRVPKGFSPDLFCQVASAAVDVIDVIDVDVVAPAPVLDCVSWSLRSCLKSTTKTSMMWGFDFSQIEARVLAWLAGQQDVLDVFRSGADVYVWAAAQFGSNDRQLGKVLILALGFGMGATKLRETARKNYGVTLTLLEAEKFKNGWRRTNDKIVQFWYDMQYAAEAAILRRGTTVAVGGSGVAFHCTTKTLQMRLPSGRVLYYHKPSIDRDDGSIRYWGTEVGGQWVEQRTWGGKLAENVTQAAARDIMSEAMLRTWRRQQEAPCMTVHDELVYAVPQGSDLQTFEGLMLEAPPWAGGLPIAGEAKIMSRYGVVHSLQVISI